MAKKWYPVIDILTCVECGTCVEFCPSGAISYVGDTGDSMEKKQGCCCCGE